MAEEGAERGAKEEAPRGRKVHEQSAAGCRRRKEDVQLRSVRAARQGTGNRSHRDPVTQNGADKLQHGCCNQEERPTFPDGHNGHHQRRDPQGDLHRIRDAQGNTWAHGRVYNSDGAARECVLASENTYAAEHGGKALRMICRSWASAESRPSGLRTPGAINEACAAVSAARNGRGPGHLFGVVVHKGRHRYRVGGTRVVADNAGHACLKC